MSITIAGTGHFVPDFVVSNDDFAAFLDTSDEWIRTRTGMQRRHISMGEPTWYLGAMAANNAMEMAAVGPEEIDLILCTTVSGDFRFPSIACLIQGEIGAVNATAMDLSTACAGVTYSVDMARRYLYTGGVDTVLVVGADCLSQLTDYTDRSSCVLFGDGAGAMVVRRGEGLYGSFTHSDPSGANTLYAKVERRQLPFGQEAPFAGWPFQPQNEGNIYMDGQEVYKFAVKAMPRAVQAACERAGITVEELDWIFPHQANLRIIRTATKNLGVDADKVYVVIQEYGNCSSGTIPIALDECVREGKLQRGQKICLVGFGAGLTYGALVCTF